MKKNIFIIIVILINVILSAYVLLKNNDNPEKQFNAKIIEVHANGNLIVEPNENEEVRKSADKISVSGNPKVTWEVGTEVIVTYTGEIMETYPAQINTIDVQKYDKYNKYNNLKIIVNIIAFILLIIVAMDLNNFKGFEIKNTVIKTLVYLGLLVFGAWVFIYDVMDIPKIFF
ncbi:MAG: hypothetical protein FWF46_00745 [Oscillospiraceae bacterium]|nr:hypothetical protein [Oscillospiraceae bacterium]